MGRTGKIARMPLAARTELNTRLQDGHDGPELLLWFNELPEVKRILAEKFEGKPVTVQNLSDWRHSGYEDWVRSCQACDLMAGMWEESKELHAEMHGESMGDHLAMVLTAEFAMLARSTVVEPGDEEKKWNRMDRLLGQFGRIRRDEHRAARTRLARQRWEWEEKALVREEQERADAAAKFARMAPMRRSRVRSKWLRHFGNHPDAEAMAEFAMERELGIKPEENPFWEEEAARRAEQSSKGEVEGREPKGEAEVAGKTSNIEHRTSNVEGAEAGGKTEAPTREERQAAFKAEVERRLDEKLGPKAFAEWRRGLFGSYHGEPAGSSKFKAQSSKGEVEGRGARVEESEVQSPRGQGPKAEGNGTDKSNGSHETNSKAGEAKETSNAGGTEEASSSKFKAQNGVPEAAGPGSSDLQTADSKTEIVENRVIFETSEMKEAGDGKSSEANGS